MDKPDVCRCFRARDKGLRTAALIRFIGAEDGLLSHTHDGPRMYINLEGKFDSRCNAYHAMVRETLPGSGRVTPCMRAGTGACRSCRTKPCRE